MNLTVLGRTAQKLAVDNSPQILTAVGVVGVVSTALLTGKAAYRAGQLIADSAPEPYALDPREKFELTWKLFIPAAGSGLLTISAIVAGSHISASRAAGLAAAFTISERAFDEYRDKIVQKMGPKKEQEARDEIAQERVQRNNDSFLQLARTQLDLIVVSGTDVICYDMYSDRYFTGSMEALKQAQNNLNHRMLSDGYASLSDFYELIGLPPTQFSDQIGWVSDELLELSFSTVLSPEQRPCLAVSFRAEPNRRFDRFL